MANFADRAGAAAYKVAAALETAGYRAQQDLLPYFNGQFGEHLGGLLYLIALIAALTILASGGSYRYGLWFLIGPPVFFFLVGNTQQIQPARWQFGERIHGDQPVQRVYREMGGPATVATFFALWNKLTTDVVQELIKTLDLTNNKSDLDFISKAGRYFNTFNSPNADRDLQFFVHMAITRPCMDYFYLLRFVNDPLIVQSRKMGAEEVLREHGGRAATAFQIAEQRWFVPWWNRVMAGSTDGECNALSPSAAGRTAYTCDEMWRVGICAIKRVQTPSRIAQICSMGLPPGDSAANTYTTRDCIARLQMKYTQQIDNGRVIRGGAGANDQTAGLEFMLNEVTARILWNEFNRDSAPLMRINLGNHPDWLHQRVFGGARYSMETAQSMRVINEGEEYTARGEIIAAAINVPYFQGTLLFFLAWTYPFFCLMTVVPGRESAILVWMSLWLWVRLWDFGFAVVMMIDNMLYALLPHGKPMASDDMNNPGRAMHLIFQTDPAYSAFTYYTLLAACIFSVPVFTGFLVKKGGGELISAVTQAMKDFPTDFGRAIGGRQRALMANDQYQLAQQYIRNEVTNAAWSAIANDPQLLQSLYKAASLTALNGMQRAAFANFQANPMDPRARAAAFQAFQQLGPEFVSRIISFESTMHRTQAMTRFELSMQLVAYRASTSEYVTQRAQTAIMLGWNSHDFRRNFPGDAMLRYMQADHMGHAWRGMLNDAFQDQRTRGTVMMLQFLHRGLN